MSIERYTIAHVTTGANKTTFAFNPGESNERIWKGKKLISNRTSIS